MPDKFIMIKKMLGPFYPKDKVIHYARTAKVECPDIKDDPDWYASSFKEIVNCPKCILEICKNEQPDINK